MVLDCLPGVASVCSDLHGKRAESSAQRRIAWPTQVANWARFLATKQDAASV